MWVADASVTHTWHTLLACVLGSILAIHVLASTRAGVQQQLHIICICVPMLECAIMLGLDGMAHLRVDANVQKRARARSNHKRTIRIRQSTCGAHASNVVHLYEYGPFR
jgi:hypothetical protein